MNGAYVGTWSMAPNAPDTLQYDLAWTRSEHGRPLSLSLPFSPGNAPQRGEKVRAYFENLLPDSREIRDRLARRFNTGSSGAFELLTEIGRDCVGALEIIPDGAAAAGSSALQAEPLNEAQIAQILRGTTTHNALGWRGLEGTSSDDKDDFRISIAGAQEKTALLQRNGRWCLPHGNTPTTHIFKLPLGLIGGLKLDMRDSVENEWLCAQILKAFGLPVAHCQAMQFEDIKVLVVERFDRTWWTHPSGDQRLIRLPQEDMCQATGTPPDARYEADGGPGIDRILGLLDGSLNREQDRRVFFKAQLLFWMLCATDGHAKNFSLFLRPGGRHQLTPLYDVLSAYPLLGEGPSRISPFKAKLAMAVRSKNAHWRIRDIQKRHWLSLGKRHGVLTEDGQTVEQLIDQIAGQTPKVIATVKGQLPKDFSEQMANAIFDGLQNAALQLAL